MFVDSKYNMILVEDKVLCFACLTKNDLMMTQENVSICGSIWVFHSDSHMWVCGNYIYFSNDASGELYRWKDCICECLLSPVIFVGQKKIALFSSL